MSLSLMSRLKDRSNSNLDDLHLDLNSRSKV